MGNSEDRIATSLERLALAAEERNRLERGTRSVICMECVMPPKRLDEMAPEEIGRTTLAVEMAMDRPDRDETRRQTAERYARAALKDLPYNTNTWGFQSYSATLEKCPRCGAANPTLARRDP